MSLAHPRDDPRDPYPDFHFQDSSNHQQILAAIADLKTDKEALKSALKAALLKRDELLERLESFKETARLHIEKRRQLEIENLQLKRDNGELVRKAEAYRREVQKLASAREGEQLEVRELIEKAKGLEEVQRQRMDRSEYAVDGDLQKYAQFMLEKLETQPELLSLFRGRVSTLRQFWASLQNGKYAECLLKCFQFVSDLLVYRSHNEEKRSRVDSPSKSVSCQTLCDQGTNTQQSEGVQERTPRFPADWEAKKPANDPSSRLLSPRSLHSASVYSPKAYRSEDGYAKLMDESEHLLSSLHYQSDRLVKLNSQLQQTMQSSPRRSPQYRDMTPSQLFRDESATSLRKPYIGIPSSPQSLQPVLETLKTEELSSDKEVAESIPEAISKLSPTSGDVREPKRLRKPGTTATKPRSVRKSPPNSRALQFKTDVSTRQEPVLPPLRNLQTWGSVSDFFSGSNRETDKTEDKEEQERPLTDRS